MYMYLLDTFEFNNKSLYRNMILGGVDIFIYTHMT